MRYLFLLAFVALFGLTAMLAQAGKAARTTRDCCYPGSACCFPGSPCCEGDGNCCFPGSPCCFEGSPCCEGAANRPQADCCDQCPPGSSCCGIGACDCCSGEKAAKK